MLDPQKLLPEYRDLDDKVLLKRIQKKRRRCKLVGHIWELESFDGSADYRIVCTRCFPHIHSRRRIESYNLFSTPQKDLT